METGSHDHPTPLPPSPTAAARRHLDQAYRHDEREELEAALAECEAALRISGDWAEAHNLHGIILEGLGRSTEALAAYHEALRLDPSFEEAQENLAELQADLLGERVPQLDLDGILSDLEPASFERTAALQPSMHAPHCDVCGRQDETLREAFYPYVVSALLVTFRRAFAGRWCRRHRDLRLSLAGLITVTVGWLGFPWGLLQTPLTLIKLARGGARLDDSNVELLSDLAGHKLAEGKPKEAAACLEECLRYGEQPQVLASLRDHYQTHGVAREAPAATLAGSFLRVMLFAAILGGAIGLIDYAFTFGLSTFVSVGSFLIDILSWIPLVTLLYFGGLVLARLVEGGLARSRCSETGLAGALGALSSLLATYGVLQGGMLGDALHGWISGGLPVSPAELLLTAGAVLTSGGALRAATRLSGAILSDMIFLGLLLVAGAFYVGLAVSTARGTAGWQQRLAAAREGFVPTGVRAVSTTPGWAAIIGTVVLLALVCFLFPNDQLSTRMQAGTRSSDGLALLEAGDLEGATKSFEEAVRLRPDLPGLHHDLGWCYAYGDDSAAAIAEFEESIRLDPGTVGAYEGLGWVYRRLGEFEKSIASYQAAIQLDPSYAAAYSGLGLAYLDQGNLAAAEGRFQEALDRDPEFVEAHLGVGTVHGSRGDHDLAAEAYRVALRLEPESGDAHIGLGWTEFLQGNLEAACPHFQEAVRLTPAFAEAHLGLGLCHMENDALEEAVAALQMAVEIDPQMALGYNSLGWAYYSLEMLDEAEAAFVTAVELDPTLPDAHLGLTMVRSAQRDE